MNLELSGVQVRCPNCGDIYYETTETYDPAKMTTGDMLRFTPKYGPGGYNWSLPFSDQDMSEGLLCPECGGDMAPSGYLGLDRLVFDTDKPTAEATGDDLTQTQAIVPAEEEDGIGGHAEAPVQESKDLLEDPLAKYLTQRACPECGRFFGVDEFEAHLNSHPPEVRAEILKRPETVAEDPPIMPAKPLDNAQIGGLLSDPPKGTKKMKAKEGWFKGKKLIPEVDEPIRMQCPMCEEAFEQEKQGEYNAHLKTHDLVGVQQAMQQ